MPVTTSPLKETGKWLAWHYTNDNNDMSVIRLALVQALQQGYLQRQ